MAVRTSLTVNGTRIEMNPFVEDYCRRVTAAILESLKDTEPVRDLMLTVEDKRLKIRLNGGTVDCNEFVTEIIISILAGMAAPLKGVTAPILTLAIKATA